MSKRNAPGAVLYPHEAEQGIIGTLLHYPALWESHGANLDGETFGTDGLRSIFAAMAKLAEDNTKISTLGVATVLRDQSLLDGLHGHVGGQSLSGFAFIAALEQAIVTAGTSLLPSWIKACQEASKRRAIVRACQGVMEKAQSARTADEAVGSLASALVELSTIKGRGDETREMFAEVDRQVADRESGDIAFGLKTKVPAWDSSLHGILPQEMMVIGARPKVGKTSAVETAIETLIENGHHVVIFEKDMSPALMLVRMACRRATVTFESFMDGTIQSGPLRRMKDALNELRRWKHRLHVYSNPRLSAAELSAIVRREIKEHKIAVWFLDHFQLLSYEETNRTEGLLNASLVLRELINETKVPGVIIAQLNAEADKGEKPRPSQFKYCDQLNSDADRIVLMWSSQDPKDLHPNETQDVHWTVEFNRFGAVSDNVMSFWREKMIFKTYAAK